MFEKANDAAKKEDKKEEERGEDASSEDGLTKADQRLFEKMVMGMTAEELKKWAEKISKEKSQEYLSRVTREQQVADSKQGMRAYAASFFGFGGGKRA